VVRKEMTVVVDPINIISYGGTLIGGTALGFAMSYFLKKLLKLIAIILGESITLLTFLQYKGWISPHWDVIQKQLSDVAQYAAKNTVAAKHGLNSNTVDMSYPLFGVVGFFQA
jgi:uncharacterized membrane protein (Fun14 family)